MDANRLSTECWNDIEEFIKFVVECANNPNRIKCLCIQCFALRMLQMNYHLFVNMIDKCYTRWICHCNSARDRPINSDDRGCNEREEIDSEGDKLEDMIHDIQSHFMDHPHLIQSFKDDADKSLYIGCSKFTKLSALLRLHNLKAGNWWSDKSFTNLLSLLKDMLHEANELPDRTYDAKKILCSIGMNYEMIHACLNDCILYRKNYDALERCLVCELDWFKKNKNKILANVLWYFPVTPKFKRMFRNAKHAKSLMWHSDGRISNKMLRHLVDSLQ